MLQSNLHHLHDKKDRAAVLQSTPGTSQEDAAHLMAKAIRRKSSATGTEIVALPSGTKPMEHTTVLQSTLQQRDGSQGMDRAMRRMSSVSGMETLGPPYGPQQNRFQNLPVVLQSTVQRVLPRCKLSTTTWE